MPQANELEFQGGAATKPEGEDGNDGRQNRDHACEGTAVARKSLNFFYAIRSFEQAQRFALWLCVVPACAPRLGHATRRRFDACPLAVGRAERVNPGPEQYA
jgi:hypothetical protein